MPPARVPTLQVLAGKKLTPLDPARLAQLCDAAERVVIDVGTGDARTAHRLAKANPSWLVIGIDPAWQRMTETAVKAARKEAKGGAPNLLLVNASIETVPAALHGRGDEVMALMPWGKLLRGIVLGEADVCGGLRAVAKAGAPLDVAIGTSIWREPIPLEIRDLPELTPDSAAEPGGLTDRLAALGWQVTEARLVPHTELDRISSSWARRLGSGATETVLHLRAVAADTADAADAADAANAANTADTAVAAGAAVAADTALVADAAVAADAADTADTALAADTADAAVATDTTVAADTAGAALVADAADVAVVADTAGAAVAADTADSAVPADTAGAAGAADPADVAVGADTADAALAGDAADAADAPDNSSVAADRDRRQIAEAVDPGLPVGPGESAEEAADRSGA